MLKLRKQEWSPEAFHCRLPGTVLPHVCRSYIRLSNLKFSMSPARQVGWTSWLPGHTCACFCIRKYERPGRDIDVSRSQFCDWPVVSTFLETHTRKETKPEWTVNASKCVDVPRNNWRFKKKVRTRIQTKVCVANGTADSRILQSPQIHSPVSWNTSFFPEIVIINGRVDNAQPHQLKYS